MSEERLPDQDERAPKEAEERVSAAELRRRQQLGQTPGMFVDPPSGGAQEPDADAAGEPHGT
ncbi:hypothetical protein ACFQY4_17645 [Catellatospora bangladeshensis]|uniref:Uncharacterized protein n=1 Tax=Catellatospora bangladeshensis TaxID=310355 RepID=A0A8J3JNK2_9ACTN|nr:hypothetical protein [Catellatospora bangladeshensis]GIF82155.1 hypothetical protein Cba03nite_35040 [Catellatospora bangladeshensis]